ncbi:MarR family winged helix-turn-helix transcriptional regulator [Nonomuraea sp. NPDC005501]|uniref:MarR family winged helix-turn-helix transcriptional regulator n=1 Tax=Nonomuraea sp. NPDC005501 TaxID=3156884 RepID=UPI0033BA3A7D
MEHVSAGKDGLARPQCEALDGVAAALATVGNWMFAPATRRKIMAFSRPKLSLGDYTLLAKVSAHAPVRLSVLAVDKSTLSPPAKRLESRGLIERQPDPADTRAQLVSVTRAGKLAIGKLWKARGRRRRPADGLGGEEAGSTPASCSAVLATAPHVPSRLMSIDRARAAGPGSPAPERGAAVCASPSTRTPRLPIHRGSDVTCVPYCCTNSGHRPTCA